MYTKISVTYEQLKEWYEHQNLSVAQIAERLKCSEGAINYHFKKYGIQKRNISEAGYLRRNPNGDPFHFVKPKTAQEWNLFGLGIGLYWGEGTKSSKNSLRLANSDPKMIKTFIEFLIRFWNIDSRKLSFQLQIFSDTDAHQALIYWNEQLAMSLKQWTKTHIHKAKEGTYKKKKIMGVATLSFHNTKLKNSMMKQLQVYQEAN